MTSRYIQQFIITSDVGILRGRAEQINSVLREQVRMKQGKPPRATAAIVDSQKSSNDGKKRKVFGFDGGKLVKGRKRHILVDTQRLLMGVVRHPVQCFRTIRGNDSIGRRML